MRVAVAAGTATAALGALLVIGLGALVLVLPVDDDVARVTLAMTLTLGPGLIPMIWFNILR